MSGRVRETIAAYGIQPRLMNVEEYYHAAEKGVFKDDEKLELLRGEVVLLSPQKSRHAAAISSLEVELRGVLGKGYFVRLQSPLRLDDFNEPEPNAAVIRGSLRDYVNRHPGPSDAVLVIEVADATIKKERRIKKALYAEFPISEYWIVDLAADRLEVYREPVQAENGKWDYSVSEFVGREGEVSPLSGPRAAIKVENIILG